MTTRTVAASTLRVRTYAKGLFAALAHDLELDLPASELVVDELDEGKWSGRIVVAIDAIRVIGVVRRGVVSGDVLSAGDRAEIEKRLREACAPAKTLVVTGAGTVDASGRAQGAEVVATLENKGTAPLKAHVLTLRRKREGRDDLELRAEG
ncbi:MAG: hypothetical protein ABI175_22380, partial [Polyangiales bacterium]